MEQLYRTLPIIGKKVFRLGLAGNFGIDERGVDWALGETEINYLYWTPRMGRATGPVRRALARDRDRFVVATGPTVAIRGSGLCPVSERKCVIL